MIDLRPRHIRNIPLGKFSKNKNVPVYVQDCIVFMYDDITIGLLHSYSESCAIEFLIGHDKPIMAMCISLGFAQFLCSCCADMVIIWDIGATFLGGSTSGKPEKFIVGVELGHIEFCALSCKWLALGQDGNILIILLQLQAKPNGLEELIGVEEYATFPQRQKTSLANFSPVQPNILVVVDDNTFKVWDVSTKQLIHQSMGFGTHALTFCSFSGENPKLVLGTNKGKAHIFNFTELGSSPPWNVISVDVHKTLLQTEKCGYNDVDSGEESSESGCIVFSAKLCAHLTKNEETLKNKTVLYDSDTDQYNNTLRCILAPGTLLIVFSSRGITIFDCKSSDCRAHLHLQELVPGQSLALVDFALLTGETLDELTCVVKSSERGASIKIVSLQYREIKHKPPASTSSVISNVPVKASSVLRQQIKLSSEKSAYKSGEKGGKVNLKSPISSRYGQESQQQMFVPIINVRSKSSNINPKNKYSSSILSAKLIDTSVIESYGPPKQNVQEVCISETAMPIHLAASGDGNYLACTSSSSTICVVPFKNFDLGKSVTLISHDALINNLHFNLDSNWLISSSKDSTAKIWDWKNKKCVLNIDKKKGLKSHHQKQANCGSFDIIDASFYYMDEFILAASGNLLEMYCHQLNDPSAKPNSLGQFRRKLVHSTQVPSQHITCFSAANQLHSYIVLCGCSDKTVRVYDMNAESFCVELVDVHSRSPHRLRQVTGSACSAEMHDLFLTAAFSDCVRLWDLRSLRCVQKYSRHTTRGFAAGIDVSPCARFVAVGSEDRAVYVYDTRKPEDYLGKLPVRGDVAIDVVFSPNKPFLAASTLNGYLTKFSA